MDWMQKIAALQKDAQSVAAQVGAAEAKVTALKGERQRVSAAVDAAEAELVAIAKSATAFQNQAIEAIKALYAECDKTTREKSELAQTAKVQAESIEALKKTVVATPAPQPKPAPAPVPTFTAPKSAPAPTPVSTDDDEFDLDALK